MKKIFALMIAVTAILGTLTSCGNNESENPSSSISESSASVAETSEESTEPETKSATTETVKTTVAKKTTTVVKTTAVETTPAVTTEAVKTDVSETSPVSAEIEYADEYISTLRAVFEAEVNSDITKMFELFFPKDVFESMEKAGMLDFMMANMGDINNELAIEELDDYENMEIRVVSVRDAESSEIESVKKEYSKVKGMCDCLIGAGVTYDSLLSGNMPADITDEEMLKLAQDISVYSDENSDVEITVDFQSYKYVTFAFVDNQILQAEFPMFITDDGTAKIDLLMIENLHQNN